MELTRRIGLAIVTSLILIISFILVTIVVDSGVMLFGKIRSYTLFGLRGKNMIFHRVTFSFGGYA